MTSVTVEVPMTIRRRGGRKQIIGPDGAPIRASGDAAATRGNPALVKALARAFRWRRMLEDGRYGSIRELAAAEGVDRAYVGRVLNLTLLAPELVESVLRGLGPERMAHSNRQPPLHVDWRQQCAALPQSWTCLTLIDADASES
jgi:hypothetical protein